MLNSQTNPESIQEIPTPLTMTQEEFLENDLEGYEHIKGNWCRWQLPQLSMAKSVLTL